MVSTEQYLPGLFINQIQSKLTYFRFGITSNGTKLKYNYKIMF